MSARRDSSPRKSAPRALRLSRRLARLLLCAFPAAFRRRYARGMAQNTDDLLADTYRARGLPGLLLLWPRLLRDLLIGGLAERARPSRVPSPGSAGMIDSLLQDLRYAWRAMRARPVLSVLAVLTLALGIGASAAMFSVIDGVLLRDLPYPESDRLMSVYTTIPEWQGDETLGGGWDRTKWSYEEFRRYAELQSSFSRISVYETASANLVEPGPAVRIRVGLTGTELLPMLGAIPHHGRLFTDADRTERAAVALVAFEFWRDRMGSDPEALGRSIELDGEEFSVVGVLPDGFAFGSRAIPVWLPIFENRPWGYFPGNTGDGSHLLRVAGRLAPGVGPEQAADEAARLLPEIGGPDHFTQHGATVIPRLKMLTEDVRPALWILMGAVVLLLLVACANVATFLLGQAVDRQQEIAIRGALGAGNRRIVRQLLTESLLLASIGGLVGLMFGYQGVRALTAIAPTDLPRLDAIALDLRAVGFAVVIATVSGLLFGLAPALTLARAELSRTLGAARFGSATSSRLQSAMIVAEVAIATLLLVGAGLLVRSFLQLNSVDPGFEPEGILRVNLSPDTTPFFDSEGTFQPAAMDGFLTAVEETLAALPEVETVTLSQVVPFTGFSANNNVTGSDYDGSDGWQTIAERRFVGPRFHQALDIELVAGRYLRPEDDRPDAAPVVLVNESLARRFWPEGDAVGKELVWWEATTEVVGVVGDIRERGLDAEPRMSFYAPRRNWNMLDGDFLLAVDGDPAARIESVRATIRRAYPELVIVGIEPLSSLIADSLAEARYRTRLIGVFALVAALLSVLGLYAVTSRSVAGRTREIGIRVALGAGSRSVISLLVGDGIRLAALGAGIGIAAALLVTRVLSGVLYGVRPHDPVTLIAIGGLVALLAVAASLVPSLRAARIDTVRALRADQ